MEGLLHYLLEQGKREGVSSMELLYLHDRGLQIRVFGGQIDTLKLSQSRGVGIRVIKEGRCGFSYTEVLEKDALMNTLGLAIANSQISPIDPCQKIISTSLNGAPSLDLLDRQITDRDIGEKIRLILDMERIAKGYHPKIVNVPYASYFEGWREIRIVNSAGFDGGYQRNGWGVVIEVMAQEGEEIKSPVKYGYATKVDALDTEKIARDAAQEALNRLGAREPQSGNYPVIFLNEVARDLLATFSGVFSAKKVQQGLSLLAGKLGQPIATPGVCLIDDPLLKDGYVSRPFDDEGVPSSPTELIKRGVLNSFLHNSYTACKDGTTSTSNGSRPSIRSSLEIAPSNLYLMPGQKSLAELMVEADRGILVVELDGLHSGANPISGDFSLGAQGYLFQQGSILHPLHNFTVSGNFFQLLRDLVALGNDLEFSPPLNGSAIGSPSLLVGSLSIGGI